MVQTNLHDPRLPSDGSVRSKSLTSSPSSNRRSSAFSLPARSNDSESAEEVRGSFGLNLLYTPSEPLIDFIFVHGLRGGSRKTWSKTGDESHFWPKVWLPREPHFKNARIHSFGYNSDWAERKGSKITIHDFGQALLSEIQNILCPDRDASSTPIVLIGHSMGGIVIKKVLLLARQDPLYHHLAARIHSMFFLATPHRGADSAQLLSNLLRMTVSHGYKAYVENLMPNSDAIQVINDGFRHVYQGVQLWSFFETLKTGLGLIVEKDSAVLDLPGERVQLLNADHRNVCKFDDPSDSNYCSLKNAFVATISSIKSTWYSSKGADRQRGLRSLSTYLGLSCIPENDLANVTDSQMEGTCQWLTELPSFTDWRSGIESNPKFFWLTGDPATGKSILAGHVAKHLQQMNGDCAHFFFKHHSTGKCTVAELLRSLAWQMASLNTEIRRRLLKMQEEDIAFERTDERAVWRTIFMSQIFRVELRQPHFWVIDGLDECTGFMSLFPLLAKIDAQFPLLVFITSRPSLTIERALLREQILSCYESVTRERSLGDIALYVRAHARYLPCQSDESREQLVLTILEKSDGNFLWTKLVVKELQEAMSEQRIRSILESVPQEIDQLYDRIFEQLMASPKEARLVVTTFSWIICASRPLTIDELIDALHLDIEEMLPQLEKNISSICGNLAIIDSQMRVWPAHQTVREYLYRQKGASRLTLDKTNAHSQISRVCLKYLQGEEMKVPRYRRGSAFTKQRKRSPFHLYAIRHFSDHIVRASPSIDSLLLSLDGFLQNTSLAWLELIATAQDLSPLTSTARNLKTYLERRARHQAPIGSQIQHISQWANDLVHLVAQCGKAMIASPPTISHLLPPICPSGSAIHQAFSDYYPRGLRIVGLSQTQWDDHLCCIDFTGVQALSVACKDNLYALGLSDGYLKIYSEVSFQEKLNLYHDEPVRQIAFSNLGLYIASAGRKRLSLWDAFSGVHMWSSDLIALPMAIEFNEVDELIMLATRANTLGFWAVDTGKEIDVSKFCDINEEDQSEYHYKRSPIQVRLASSLNVLGVAYRQRPISFWDLEENVLIGQYHKAGAVYPEPLIHDFTFNPNTEICLAAVAYEGAQIAIFDPFTQHTIASANAQVSSLAVSLDGTLLVSGSGDGVVQVYEFETLKLIYQVSSLQLDIRALAFNNNSLRILDIRGNQFNVWEPPTLAYRPKTHDDSSFNFSESLHEGPEYVATPVVDDDLVITAIATHHSLKAAFCGRENGTVAIYSLDTGQEMKFLFQHCQSLAIASLDWGERQGMLVAIDRSGGYSVLDVTEDDQRELQCKLVLQGFGCRARQILLNTNGNKILVVTSESCELWNRERILEARQVSSQLLGHASWVQNPNFLDRLLLFTDDKIKDIDWGSLERDLQMHEISGSTLEIPAPSVTQILSSSLGRFLCMYSAGSKSTGQAPYLRLHSMSSTTEATSTIKQAASFDDIAKEIKCIAGVHKSQMVFLNHHGWVCSLNIDTVSPERFYTRHFFIPLQWHSGIDKLALHVTNKGHILLAVKNEVAVFHNGLNFEERVTCKGSVVSTKPPMRAVMKRGTSQP